MSIKSLKRLVALFLLLVGFNVVAQTGPTQMSPGVAGERDARGRNPELFVTRVAKSDHVSLLVDAHVPHKDYQQYPIKFEFYINRKFVDAKIRSKELPGPIGLDIGAELASPPFNYAVIAYVLHPTRSTHSMVTGAVYTTELGAEFDCDLSISAGFIGNEQELSLDASTVAINQTGNSQISFETEAFTSDQQDKLPLIATLNLEGGDKLSGVIQIGSGSRQRTVSVAGEAQIEDNAIASLSVSSPDEFFVMNCN